MFAGYPQRRAAGDQQPQAWASRQSQCKLGACAEDLLTVVQHQQQVEVLDLSRERSPVVRRRDVECPEHDRRQSLGVRDTAQVDEDHAIGEAGAQRLRHAQGQATLANTRRTGHGQRAAAEHQAFQLVFIGRATDKAIELDPRGRRKHAASMATGLCPAHAPTGGFWLWVT